MTVALVVTVLLVAATLGLGLALAFERLKLSPEQERKAIIVGLTLASVGALVAFYYATKDRWFAWLRRKAQRNSGG